MKLKTSAKRSAELKVLCLVNYLLLGNVKRWLVNILIEAEDYVERVERRGLALSHSATSGLYAPSHVAQSLYTPISSSVKGVIIILAQLSSIKGGNICTSLLSQGLRK